MLLKTPAFQFSGSAELQHRCSFLFGSLRLPPGPSCPAPTGHLFVIPGTDWGSHAQRHPDLHPHQRRWRRHQMDERLRLVLLHLQRSNRIRHTSRMPIRSSNKNFPDKRIRTDYIDNDPDWEENFYILRHSLCPAVLTENFFMDNKKDFAYLISDEGKRNLINTIIQGITSYCMKKVDNQSF